jgi:uncharacterized protein DUF2017
MFRRHGEQCVARFAADEVAVLRQVASEVIGLLSENFDRDDPVVERLFPDVYTDDVEQSAEFRRYTEGDLKTAKIDQAAAILAALPEGGGAVVRLDAEAAEAWLRALNDVRLALGIRLDVHDDTDLLEELDDAVMRDPTSARVRQLTMYEYLGVLQESLLDSITNGSL